MSCPPPVVAPRLCCLLRAGWWRGAWLLALVSSLGGEAGLQAQTTPKAEKLWPNLATNIERPLRYPPEGEDFVILNGGEWFNRPLYGGNTAFRVDGGDKPEFVLYLPGRGGNLRLGLVAAAGVKWLHEAAQIETRYRPGQLIYRIRDPLLGDNAVLDLAVVASHQAEALLVRIEGRGLTPGVELAWAFGGVNGQRGRRDGDIGTENIPIGEWFQFRPELCAGNHLELGRDTFTLTARLPRDQTATVRGLVPAGSTLAMADATLWNDCAKLFGAGAPFAGALGLAQGAPLQIVTGRVPFTGTTPLFLALVRADPAPAPDLDTYRAVQAEQAGPSAHVPEKSPQASSSQPGDLPAHFAAAETHFARLRGQVKVVTPDPYLNAAVGALNVAADAVWDDPQQAIMHGAIAWRTKLLGWRGPYALDALGWTDRARRHFESWAMQQNLNPIPDRLPPPEEETNLARSRTALHSNGNLSNNHYDMNLVFFDAFFRHLRWTGDVEFARKMWPVLERHLAWERRLFRREFPAKGWDWQGLLAGWATAERLPLYEAYAAIWASDDLQYSGGGTAHGSAYNYWHNRMAAQLASLIGIDPAPFQREADLIGRGMYELLWVDDDGNPLPPGSAAFSRGHFAETKDLLGRQLVHPSAALWTFYHAVDSEVPGASAMADYIIRRPRLPVRGPGVPADDDYGMLSTSDWMPYTWSINNVVMGENAHTALALWQSHKPREAFRLLKSSLLASMFMGVCPGNVGSMNYLDVYRRESQRDFADGSGVLSRALVEGLFGLRPDALRGVMVVAPGFPAEWSHASLEHPAIQVAFVRRGGKGRFEFKPGHPGFRTLALVLPVSPVPIKRVTVEYADGTQRVIEPGSEGMVRWTVPFAGPVVFTVEWAEAVAAVPEQAPPEAPIVATAVPAMTPDSGRMEVVDLAALFNDRVTNLFAKGKYRSPRSPFVSLALPAQGIGYWAGHVNAIAEIDDTGLRTAAEAGGGRIVLPTGVPLATPGAGPNVVFTSQWDNYPREATVPLTGRARRVHLLLAGSTNAMQSRLDNGEVVVAYADGTTSRLALRNPETWWPIEQDYFVDDYQFRVTGLWPIRVDLKTGLVRQLAAESFKGQGRTIPGGAATGLVLGLDPGKELRSLTVRALANDVVVGLMAATLER